MTALLPLFIGIWFLIFGLKLLFQKGYVETKYGTLEEQKDDKYFPKNETYFYNKYGRGIASIIAGIGMIGASLVGLLIK